METSCDIWTLTLAPLSLLAVGRIHTVHAATASVRITADTKKRPAEGGSAVEFDEESRRLLLISSEVLLDRAR
jgi:hypothetical protein